jgi:hypothetical protein
MGSIPSTPVKETPPLRHIWIITGPSGCGKSTIAQFIARELQLPYIEGDDVSIQPVEIYLIGPNTDWLATVPFREQCSEDGERHPAHRRRSMELARDPPQQGC